MTTHRFAFGDIVSIQGRALVKRPDSYEVVALMPPRDGVVQYRIKSVSEKFERVVREDDLALSFDGHAAENSTFAAQPRN